MSILDNLKKFVQPYSDEGYDDYDDELEDADDEMIDDAPRGRRPSPFATAENSEPSYGSTPTSTAASSGSSGFSGQILNMGSGKQEVVLFHAKSFDSAAKAADELRKKKAVILNMENVDKALTRRVVDFLSGSVYALDGSVKKIAQSTYLFCPHNMDVVGDLDTVGEIESYI
jgi:FtsZ-interacting cell division protein YlmF